MISRRNDSRGDIASRFSHAAPYVDNVSSTNVTVGSETAFIAHQNAIASRVQSQAGEYTPDNVILVIDDEEVVRSVTRRILERFGFHVLLANDGMAGLELFQAYASVISCVLLDLSMPQLTGEDLYYEIYRLNPDMRMILMSGYSEEELINRFHGVHPPAFLVKPFTAQDLHMKVRQVIDA